MIAFSLRTNRATIARARFARRQSKSRRSAFMLVIVLVMIALLSLLAAGYTFMVRAHVDTVQTRVQQFKVRMAAEAGFWNAVVVLRDQQGSHTAWFDNEDTLRAVPVTGVDEEAGIEAIENTSEQRTYDPTADAVLRYHLMAPDPDDPKLVRYGFSDECSRLDINAATEDQLRNMFQRTIPANTDYDVDINALVDALLDWREPGNSPRPNGAKDEYYQTLRPPYRAKKGRFSTVEELLLVKGFTGWVLYGEDYNRNGLLEPNEDDGDESFPPDDADGNLFQGVARYLTVWGMDSNTSGDNRPRIFLNNQDLERLQEQLEEDGIDSDIINYILDVRSAGKTFNSVMNLIPAPPPPEEDEGALDNEETPPTTQPSGEGDNGENGAENSGDQNGDSSDQDQNGSGSENTPPSTPPTYTNLTEEEPPGTYEDLPILLDRLTVQQLPFTQGSINVSTAPEPVIAAIPNLSDAEVRAIMEVRKEVTLEERSSPAWLLTRGALDENRFRQILNGITTKSSVYRVESVGYADNFGVVERLMVVLQMRGPIPQVMYYRNMNELGPSYTPHGDERRDLAGRSD